MATSIAETLFAIGAIDDSALFSSLFAPSALQDVFDTVFASSTSKGTDRRNGFQFVKPSSVEFPVVSVKCMVGQYRFAPFLEVLKTKDRKKPPRLIGIPTIRDRVVLHQMNRFLAATHPERVPKSIASTYVRQIAADLQSKAVGDIWVCSTDIKTFYDSIQQDRLLKVLGGRINCWQALRLIHHALRTPTVPMNTRRGSHADFRSEKGVPQGLSISNILASIYMQDTDVPMKKMDITYYRYVDDVLIYGEKNAVNKAFASLRARLRRRGLSLHKIGSGKTHLAPLSNTFGYLGYTFRWPEITVRDSTIERFLQSIAAKFSDYVHNRERRLAKFAYLTEARVAEIFLSELNERITGAINQKRRYGWIAYFNQITDLTLLHRLDQTIAGMFVRLADFHGKAPGELKRLGRAYFEMKFNSNGGYVRNYDKIVTRAQKLKFLIERGRVGPTEALTDDQINSRYEAYVQHILAAMHADEGVAYG